MRSEHQMLELIINMAKNDERIRAVILNGSRANPQSPRDIFQDWDIVYLVSEAASFKQDDAWLNRFGELMIMQQPEDMGNTLSNPDEGFTFLMQFMDGNRLDLSLVPTQKVSDCIKDSLSLVLLDKDQLIPPLAPPSERAYLPQPPTAKQFADCCNEFWWVCPYVAKGLWRGQITYAKYMLDVVIRDELMKMLVWYVGLKTQFLKNPGGYGKYLPMYLEPELWAMLLNTYADANFDNTWEALYTMTNLFRQVARPVAEHFDFAYPVDDDRRVGAHLKHVRSLPRNANEIY